MNDYARRAVMLLLLITVVVLSVSHVKRREPIVKIIRATDPNYVQNPYEAQERLKAQGLYDGKIDGIWGKNTDKAYCDYMAIRSIEGRDKK